VNEGVSVRDVDGDVSVEAVNGDVVLDGVQGRVIEASTVNGDVNFLGPIVKSGRYRFASHAGDLTVVIPSEVNATISVATFNGDFNSTFPIKLSETGRGKNFNFVLGNGSAEIDLETFEGEINLRRGGDGQRVREVLRRKEQREQRVHEKHQKIQWKEENAWKEK
jgi:DUF4097 and DUF4098 domain-containing protein YvlB